MCKKTAVIVTLMLLMPLFCAKISAGEAKEGKALNARQAFALIPTEIFENTHSPLSEEEKDQLAEQGITCDASIRPLHGPAADAHGLRLRPDIFP